MRDFTMFLKVSGVDQNVVKINGYFAFRNEVCKDVVHHVLESGRGIGHSEEHDGWFEQSTIGNKGSFELVAFSDPNVVVPPTNIKLGKELGASESIDQLRNQG